MMMEAQTDFFKKEKILFRFSIEKLHLASSSLFFSFYRQRRYFLVRERSKENNKILFCVLQIPLEFVGLQNCPQF
jgi:hypothetical protein